MQNALLFTGLLLGAAVLGGFVGSCCGSKRREDNSHEARIAELEERLDSLADHAMEEVKKNKARIMSLEDSLDAFQSHVLEQEQAIHAQLDEHDFLIGDTPTGGLLGRVGALEEVQRKNALAERIEEVRRELLEEIKDIVGTGEEIVLGGRSLEELASRVAKLEDAVGATQGTADAPVETVAMGEVGRIDD